MVPKLVTRGSTEDLSEVHLGRLHLGGFMRSPGGAGGPLQVLEKHFQFLGGFYRSQNTPRCHWKMILVMSEGQVRTQAIHLVILRFWHLWGLQEQNSTDAEVRSLLGCLSVIIGPALEVQATYQK